MRIYLIGFMGSGKSFTGQKLAELMQYPFFDLDDVIEEKAGQSIKDIFSQHGEAHFRATERDTLRVLKPENAIISCGGGTPCFFDNMDWINNNGISVFLDTSVSLLVKRLEQEMNKRPLLEGKSSAELANFIENKVAERRPYYEQASVIYYQKNNEDNIAQELHSSLLNIIGH